MQHVDLASSAERMVEVRKPKGFSPGLFPGYIKSLNPWMYWQLADANVSPGSTVVDSASGSQATPTGHAWSVAPMPPPNNGLFQAAVLPKPGLLNDTRTAVQGGDSGVNVAGLGWSVGADPPLQGNDGFWIANHVNCVTLNAQPSFNQNNVDFLWKIASELGLFACGYVARRSDIPGDVLGVIATVFNDGIVGNGWVLPLGTLTGKHQIIIKSFGQVAGNTTVDAWVDGVEQGAQVIATPGQNGLSLASEGIQVCGQLNLHDAITFQDMVVMPLTYNPATDMSNALAAALYSNWSAEF